MKIEKEENFGSTWQRATISKCWANISTSFPLPSSPHWQPSTPETWLSAPMRLPEVSAAASLVGGGATGFAEHTTTFRVGRTWRREMGRWVLHIAWESRVSDEMLFIVNAKHTRTIQRDKREKVKDANTKGAQRLRCVVFLHFNQPNFFLFYFFDKDTSKSWILPRATVRYYSLRLLILNFVL